MFIGRFIPFGVRNALFITAGMGKMPFGQFLFYDGIACLISNSTLFLIAFQLGKNYQLIFAKLRVFKLVLFALFALVVIVAIWYKRAKKT